MQRQMNKFVVNMKASCRNEQIKLQQFIIKFSQTMLMLILLPVARRYEYSITVITDSSRQNYKNYYAERCNTTHKKSYHVCSSTSNGVP